MAQHDYVIDNQSFPATRTDLNNLFQAIASCNSGATAPSTTYANQLWYDTANNKLYIRNEDGDAWIELFVLDQTGDHLEKIGNTITLDGTGKVGIGNTPSTELDVTGAVTIRDATEPSLRFLDTNAANSDFTIYSPDGSNHLRIKHQSTDKVTMTSSGDVGIGTTSPVRQFHVHESSASANTYIHMTNNSTGATTTDGFSILITTSTGEAILNQREAQPLSFRTQNTERMRIKDDGTVLIGQTADDSGVAGHIFNINGSAFHVRDGGLPFVINRLTDDGAVAAFRQDGSTRGQINTKSGDMAVGTGDTGVRFNDGLNAWQPFNMNTNAFINNTVILGTSGAKFNEIFCGNSTINTSDETEKQDIASLTDKEIKAATAISKLFKTYKYKDAVASKGDNARTHTGVIAQQVRSALEAEGLDATKYSFWCSDTWWEHSVEVSAVEAVEAVTETQIDDDGNEVQVVVQEAVEAQEAYTRIDDYYTADEAPEGSTEKTLLGIRYPELLSFIGAATEQRLTSIEARLTALEA